MVDLFKLYELIAAWVPKVRRAGAKEGARLLEEIKDEVRSW